jgi:PilZ domain
MNKRSQERRPAKNFGRIILPETQEVVACAVLDISDGGARLFVDPKATKGRTEIPDSFRLVHTETKLIHDAKVVRRMGKTIGVQFLSTITPSRGNDASLPRPKNLPGKRI